MQPQNNSQKQCFIFADPCRASLAGLHNMLSRPLKERPWLQAVNVFSCQQLFQELQKNPDAIIMANIHLTEFQVMETCAYIKKKYPYASLILLSVLYSTLNVRMVNTGYAAGYILTTEATGSTYEEAIDAAIKKLKYFSPGVKDKIAAGHALPLSMELIEWKVFYYIIQNYTIPQIADFVCRIDKTVYRILKGINKKTNTKGNVGLMQYAYKHGYVTLEEIDIWLTREDVIISK